MFVLLLFWYGPTAAVIQKIDVDSEASCMKMKASIQATVDPNVAGTLRAFCIAK